MKRKYISGCLCAAIIALLAVTAVPRTGEAFFGVTIEDLMEWFGINRTDRSKDIKDNMIKSVELTYILPELVFKGGDLTSVIGLGSLPQIPDIAKEFDEFKDELDDLYKLPGSFLDILTGKPFPDSALGGLLSRGSDMASKADSINWKSYQEAPAASIGDKSGAVKETRIYRGVDDMVGKTWDADKSPSAGEFDCSMFEGASTAAYLGTLTMPESQLREGMMKGAAQYGQDIKAGRIKKITGMIAEADILAYRIKKKISENEKKVTDNLGSSLQKFDSDGGAWKGTASMYASIAQQNVDNQMLIADIQELLRLRLRMKAQTASLMLSDYVGYCVNTLDIRDASKYEMETGANRKGR